MPGESILISAEIANNSRTEITGTRASLKQVHQLLDACFTKASLSQVVHCVICVRLLKQFDKMQTEYKIQEIRSMERVSAQCCTLYSVAN